MPEAVTKIFNRSVVVLTFACMIVLTFIALDIYKFGKMVTFELLLAPWLG